MTTVVKRHGLEEKPDSLPDSFRDLSSFTKLFLLKFFFFSIQTFPDEAKSVLGEWFAGRLAFTRSWHVQRALKVANEDVLCKHGPK